MRLKHRSTIPLVVSAGLLLVLYLSALVYAQRNGRSGEMLDRLHDITEVQSVRVLPHAQLTLTALGAEEALEADRPWKAWRMMRDAVDAPEATPGQVLLAARAAAGWGGWDNVNRLLGGQPWLASEREGEGLFLLGRAQEERDDPGAATVSYRRYLALADAPRAGEAAARLGRVLAEAGDHAGAAAAFGAAARSFPQIADWLTALQVEELAAAGDPAAVATSVRAGEGSAPARVRRVEAEVKARRQRGDDAGALRRLEWEARILRGGDTEQEAAKLELDRASILKEVGRGIAARELLRVVAWDGAASTSTRLDAAEMLEEMAGGNAVEALARSAAYEAAGKPGLAAKALREAITLGAPDTPGMELKLARLLYDARDLGPARSAFRRAAEGLTDPELSAEAQLYAARALYRSGDRNHDAAIREYKEVVADHPGTAAAGSASFLLGDVSSTVERGLFHYRRAAAVRNSPDAPEALYRIGDRELGLGNRGAAAHAWESYVARYPHAADAPRVAYDAARLRARAGDDDAARRLYHAAIAADPTSYFAVRAADRLGTRPLPDSVLRNEPWIGLASDRVDARNALERLNTLEKVGLHDAWEDELDATRRAFASRPAALLALAEGLRDHGHTVEGIHIGRDLLQRRNGRWDARLLRLVFPLPFADLLRDEARREGVEPMFLAGLVRQESSFNPEARSWVGARGLAQFMPSTARYFADDVGIRGFDASLLYVPEISLRMGAQYIGDLLHRYDGAEDLALCAYNAGPSRADRWRRTLGHSDVDHFRANIPFDETRQYVQLVLRNTAIYQELYGGG
ncbi:MAG TPA: transglycosylase SLT domain-containing protein [Longimicrobiaceae bacterium]|nr:transglycosylase SLT domain-containing protein [Longimicrobiaceae bacterium]